MSTSSRPLLDPDALYGIDDRDSNQITSGLSGREAYDVAQRIADERGETVFVYALDPGIDLEDGEEYLATETIPVRPRETHLADWIEQGNGYPADGSIVATDDGKAYQVTGSRGPIRTRQGHDNEVTLTLIRVEDRDDGVTDDTPVVDVRPAPNR